MNEEMKAVIDAIDKSKRILITSHENPDGDALGSTLGLGLGLEKLGKEVVSEKRHTETLLSRQRAKAKLKTYGLTDDQVASLARGRMEQKLGYFSLLAMEAGIVGRAAGSDDLGAHRGTRRLDQALAEAPAIAERQ